MVTYWEFTWNSSLQFYLCRLYKQIEENIFRKSGIVKVYYGFHWNWTGYFGGYYNHFNMLWLSKVKNRWGTSDKGEVEWAWNMKMKFNMSNKKFSTFIYCLRIKRINVLTQNDNKNNEDQPMKLPIVTHIFSTYLLISMYQQGRNQG